VNEGAERTHPRDWPARRGYKVRELECDVEVSSRSRSHSAPYNDSARARLPTTGLG
jgi:hypothetical protein